MAQTILTPGDDNRLIYSAPPDRPGQPYTGEDEVMDNEYQPDLHQEYGGLEETNIAVKTEPREATLQDSRETTLVPDQLKGLIPKHLGHGESSRPPLEKSPPTWMQDLFHGLRLILVEQQREGDLRAKQQSEEILGAIRESVAASRASMEQLLAQQQSQQASQISSMHESMEMLFSDRGGMEHNAIQNTVAAPESPRTDIFMGDVEPPQSAQSGRGNTHFPQIDPQAGHDSDYAGIHKVSQLTPKSADIRRPRQPTTAVKGAFQWNRHMSKAQRMDVLSRRELILRHPGPPYEATPSQIEEAIAKIRRGDHRKLLPSSNQDLWDGIHFVWRKQNGKTEVPTVGRSVRNFIPGSVIQYEWRNVEKPPVEHSKHVEIIYEGIKNEPDIRASGLTKARLTTRIGWQLHYLNSGIGTDFADWVDAETEQLVEQESTRKI